MDTLVTYVNSLFLVYTIIIFIRIGLSFIQVAPVRPLWRSTVQFVYDTTDWYLGIFRRIIPPLGPIDFSPIVALLVLTILNRLVVSLLQSF